MVAVPLLFGRLTAADYEDDVAKDPRIDALRDKIVCVEDKQFTQGLPRPGEALDRQRAHRRVQGRHEAEGNRGRVPDRPQAPPQGRHAGAGGEVQDQPRAPLPGSSSRPSSTCAWTRSAGGDAGQRVRRPDGHLSIDRIAAHAARCANAACPMPRDSGISPLARRRSRRSRSSSYTALVEHAQPSSDGIGRGWHGAARRLVHGQPAAARSLLTRRRHGLRCDFSGKAGGGNAATTGLYDVQIALPAQVNLPRDNDHGPQRLRHLQDFSRRRQDRQFYSLPALARPSRREAPAGVDPHRARIGAAQLRRQEGDRGAREAARQLEAERRRAPTRSRSSSRASCCRTSPACRCWSTSPRCAASPHKLGKNPKIIEPLVPVDLVVDHSVQIDYYGAHERARPQHEARVQAQPRALPVHEVGHAGLRHLQGRAAGHRHRAPGEPRVPRARRASRRTASTIPTRWSAPTATPP